MSNSKLNSSGKLAKFKFKKLTRADLPRLLAKQRECVAYVDLKLISTSKRK